MTIRHNILLLTIVILTALLTACSGNGVPYFIDDEPVNEPVDEPVYLSVSLNSISFSAAAERKSFTVNSNTEWSISCDSTWCMPSKAGSTVYVTVSTNSSTTKRSTTITVKAGDKSQTVTVTQDGRFSFERDDYQDDKPI